MYDESLSFVLVCSTDLASEVSLPSMASTCTLGTAPSQLDADILLQYSYQSTIISHGSSKANYQYVRAEPPRSIRPCMDYSRQSQYEPDATAESYGRNVSSTRHSHQAERVRHQPSTSPLPQNQWAEASTRPRDFGFIGSGFRMSAPAPTSATTKLRRRPRPLDEERLRQPLDHAMLYPQMSPYAEPNSDSDHLEFYPRSVSQPATPGHLQLGGMAPDPQITPLPRAPTYPPAGERMRGRSGYSIPDAAFNDEHEFRLFVEATAGLGPVPNMDQGVSSPISPQIQRHAEYINPPHPMDAGYIVSPLAETPTTIEALQHLAQMPQSTSEFQTEQQTEQQQLQLLESEFDNWLQAPSTHRSPPRRPSLPHMSASAPIEDWRSVPDITPIDDELPDYASSQAQAQAAQRVEATRRAEELQRRWRESGSRTIRYA
ncbi:hypothetical protein Q7P37_004684 [Cladosporium fusiforme]